MNPEKRDFNLAARIFLYLSLVANLILVISSFVKIRLNSSLEISTTQPVVNMLFTIAIIVTGMFIFRVSKIALSLFISLFIARLFIVSSLGGGYGFAFNLGANMWLIIRDLLPFMIALCFRKDGISGWKAFFMKTSNTESIQEIADNSYAPIENLEKADASSPEINFSHVNEQTSEATTIEEVNKENTSVENNIIENQSSMGNSTEDGNENNPTISTIDVENAKEDTTDTHTQKNKLSKRKLIPLFVSLILILGGVTLFALITTSVPDGFNGFENKFKYYFGMHNNTLAKEYLTKALNANANDLQKIGKEFFDMAILANPSDLEIIDSLTKICFNQAAENNKDYSYEKVIELCNINLKNAPDHFLSLSYKCFSYYQIDSLDKAYNTAELILLNDPNNYIGLTLMCDIVYQQNDSKSLIKWSKKGYELYNNDATFMYLYSKCLYDNEEYSSAKQLFEKAEKLDPDNWYRSRLIKIGGLPCTVTEISIYNKREDGTILNYPGQRLYDEQTCVITPVITLKNLRKGEYTFEARLYRTYLGEQKRAASRNFTITFTGDNKTSKYEIRGWGDDTFKYWKRGGNTIEIWWEGKKIYTKSFNIYSEFWRQLGYPTRMD